MAHPKAFPNGRDQILRHVKHDKIDAWKAQGYIVLSYDDPEKGLYETKSVMTPRFNDLSFEQWESEISALIKSVEGE